jgi:hypothetical protein
MPRNPWGGGDPLTARDFLILFAFAVAFIGTLGVIFLYFPRIAHIFEALDHFLNRFSIHDSVLSPIVVPLSFLVIGFFCVFIHELGHAIGGRLVGYQLETFLVFPFLLAWNQGKRSIRVMKKSELLGFVAFHISDLANFRVRYSVFIAGGPVANLLFAGICVVSHQLISEPVFQEIVGGTAVVSAGLGILNFIPFRSGVHATDGSKLWMLAFQPERMRRLQSIIQLRSLSLSGISAKQWPEEVVREAVSPGAETTPERFHLFLYGYIWASAKEDIELTAECLERCLESLKRAGTSTRDFLAVEAAIFQAWHRRDSEKCNRWKARIRSLKAVSAYSKLRLKICEACLEGRYQEAVEQAATFAEGLGKKSPTPATEMLKRSWLEWKSKIEQRAALSEAATKS